jgi:hypothetical protein
MKSHRKRIAQHVNSYNEKGKLSGSFQLDESLWTHNSKDYFAESEEITNPSIFER